MGELQRTSPGNGMVTTGPAGTTAPQGGNLGDILERVLDKGIVIAGDIQINLLDIELLTIKLRLLVASADKAREMGIDWWEGDPFLKRGTEDGAIEDRIKRLERAAGIGGSSQSERDT